MVKLTILFVLAFMACASAIPTALTKDIIARGEPSSDTTTTGELVTSCLCGNTTGLWCGERSSTKYKHNTISGNCNTTSLYFWSQWAVNTSGIADLVQDPCWTGKCHQLQYNRTGIDSCTSDKPKREKLTPEVVDAATKSPTQCICDNSPGLHCGSRANGKDGAPISGNCSATSLYFCSLWAVETNGLADKVQSPCWTGTCHQYDNHKNKAGIDSCTTVTAEREELAPEAYQAVTEPKTSSTPCTCGKSTGDYCGERSSGTDNEKPITGDCKPKSLYYCSPWAVNTSAFADVVQGPCWTNKCFQSAQLGYDSCTAPRASATLKSSSSSSLPDYTHTPVTAQRHSYAVPRKELDLQAGAKKPKPKPNPVPDPNCKCGSGYGWYCGNRIIVTEFKNDSKSLSGKCIPDTRYFCDDNQAATGGPALIYDEDQCSSGAQCLINEQGSDYCGSPRGNRFVREADEEAVAEHRSAPETAQDHAVLREEFTPEAATNPLAVCTCGPQAGDFCGERVLKEAKKNEHRFLTGDCTLSARYRCDTWKSTSPLPAKALQDNCERGKCYQSAQPGWDFCHH
jgi:hypothetical protein